jgi:hypothetical protein
MFLVKCLFLLILIYSTTQSAFQKCETKTSNYEIQAPPSSLNPKLDKYNITEVKLHVDEVSLTNFETTSSISLHCVDGRDTHEIFGTPGGTLKKMLTFLFQVISENL